MGSRSSAFSHLLQPALHEIFFEKYGMRPKEYQSIFSIENTTRAYEQDTEITGLGPLVQKQEGRAITYDDPVQGEIKTYTPVPYALGFRVTHELYSDDQYGIIKRMPSALSRSAHQTEEVNTWSVLNNAFSTAQLGLDRQPLCSLAHPNVAAGPGSGPYSNRLATDADLSITSLQSMLELMETTTDDRDMPILLRPKLLVIPYSLKWMAKELLESEHKPHTADNEINALKGEGLSYMVAHYLTSTSAWFLLTDKEEHYLRFFWREALSFDNDDDFDTGDAKFKAYMRFTCGFSGWRGIAGTPGA